MPAPEFRYTDARSTGDRAHYMAPLSTRRAARPVAIRVSACSVHALMMAQHGRNTQPEMQRPCMEDDMEDVQCPYCATWQTDRIAFLGTLGNRTHFRCRHCGGDWSVEDHES